MNERGLELLFSLGRLLFVIILMALITGRNFHAQANEQIPKQRILFIGDSLTEGLGVAKEEAYPALIEKKLRQRYPQAGLEVINAGISGSTTASGLRVLRFHLRNPPQVLVLALGANDALRGFPAKVTEKNLEETIDLAQAQKIPILLVGMQAPPNYGKAYEKEFSALFARLEKKKKVPLIPFLLKDVGGEKNRNLADGIHPNAEGHTIMAETVLQGLLPLLKVHH